jgi:hypothetical protein
VQLTILHKKSSPFPPVPQPRIETSVTFLWYGVVAGDGLRSVGVEALPPSKGACSILPTARHLRAGASPGYGYPGPRWFSTVVSGLRRFFLLALLSPPSLGSFLGYLFAPLGG